MNSALEQPYWNISGIFSERLCTNPTGSTAKPFPNPPLCPPPLLPLRPRAPSHSVSGLTEGGAVRKSCRRHSAREVWWSEELWSCKALSCLLFLQVSKRAPCSHSLSFTSRDVHFWWFILRYNSDAIRFSFKMYATVAFNTFIRLCEHPHWFQNYFIIPRINPSPLAHHPRFPFPPAPGSQSSALYFMDLPALDMSRQWDHTICSLLGLASFT